MNLKRREIIIIILSLFIVISVTLIYTLYKNKGSEAGYFSLIILNEDESIVYDETLLFSDGESLYDAMERNFKLICANKNYEKDETCSYTFPFAQSKVILGIEVNNIVLETDFKTTFLEIQIYENGNYRPSAKGFNNYKLTDGDKIRIVVTKVIKNGT